MNANNVTITILVLIAVIGGGYFFFTNTNEKDGVVDEKYHENDVVEDYEISPGDVVQKIKNEEDIILLDVRTLEEYEEVHLENALLLPVQELSAQSLARIGLGEDAKEKEIIIYCRSGSRSKIAYDSMKSLGYTNIKSVAGGMIHWQEDSYPFTEVGKYDANATGISEISTSGAKISFNKTVYDFGNVPQSQGILETAFEVSNNGTSVLNIGELSTSCGCTTAKISNENILPGEKATLTVYFDPNFHGEPLGKITRTVFIPTNDKNLPEAEVKIMVDILEGQ